MNRNQPIPGQRWISETEPELGIGTILTVGFGRVEIDFPAAEERRLYALESAPLRRVKFNPGDSIQSRSGKLLTIDSVDESDGLLVYVCANDVLPEQELADSISFSKPEDRLKAGKVDDPHLCDLRVEALDWRTRTRQSTVRGFTGARIDLIPHQLYIAHEVSRRLQPRVLLADEVGLGKTIEACLILKRLHLTGRAARILILVPDSLVHQWFVELLRRFNLLFSVFDEERCLSIENGDPDANPFLDSQLVLCSVQFLAASPQRSQQAIDANWDLLVVDEAHHLTWSPEASSPSYQLVEALARIAEGVLLLTATPQQLGPEGHFARLRILDPERYSDLENFLHEAEGYAEVAKMVERLLAGKALSKSQTARFAALSPRLNRHATDLTNGDDSAREKIVADLLDTFGTGRVMFRNTREVLAGFPRRRAHLYPIPAGKKDTSPLLDWLVHFLRKPKPEKVLLICATTTIVETIAATLRQQSALKFGTFHEEMNLLQRDRMAAWFAEEDGARILLCSEIGSEGRNFQFAHDLILFDLPRDPEVLEQRIGRLDRIGQTGRIQIHVPYIEHTSGETLARWFHEGLDAFAANLHGGAEIAASLNDDLDSLCTTYDSTRLEEFIERSRKAKAEVGRRLKAGYDRLLALSSSRTDEARQIIDTISGFDEDPAFDDFVIRLFDELGVIVEEHRSGSYIFRRGPLLADAFAEIPEEGLIVTFNRRLALFREDYQFLSCDHPLVRHALDLLLGTDRGTTGFNTAAGDTGPSLFLEATFVGETVAPAPLHVDRFMPATAIRIVVNQQGERVTDPQSLPRHDAVNTKDLGDILGQRPIRKHIFSTMLGRCKAAAQTELREQVIGAKNSAKRHYDAEIERLRDLKEMNNHVQQSEIDALDEQRTAVLAAIDVSHIRTDSLRLIWNHG